jgi:hypothetical protein
LPAAAVAEAATALSAGDRFFFTARQLHYELLRRGAVAAPEGDPGPALLAFDEALRAHEAALGPLSRLIRQSAEPLPTRAVAAPEALDFAVPRIMIFERPELFLFFVQNGFYRKIEMALVLWPGFPDYVWQSVLAQLRDGIHTSFYVIHDCDRPGYRLTDTVRVALNDFGPPEVGNLGLTFSQAYHVGIPVRTAGAPLPLWRGFESESEVLLEFGGYAHLEEMPPLALLRWAYGCVARGHEDVGFG